MSTGQAAAYSAVQTKINEAYRTGNALMPDQINQLQQQANLLGQATQRLDDMNTASEALSGGLKQFRNDLENGTGAWQSLADAALTTLNSISDKLIDMATKNLVQAAFGGASGGGGFASLVSGIFGGGTGGGAAAATAPLDILPAIHHTGGMIGEGGMPTRSVSALAFIGARRYHTGGTVGSDEVPIIAKAGEGVFTPAQMKALAPASSTGGSSTTVHVTQTNTFVGSDPGSEARMRAALQTTKNQAISEAVKQIVGLKSTNPAFLRNSR
jgi:hypothetical protein